MSKYELEEIVRMWALEQITHEQVSGQILLHLRSLNERLEQLERVGRSQPPKPTPGKQR